MRMGAVRRMGARSRTSFSGLLIAQRANPAAYPCASERRLHRGGEERSTSRCAARIAFFRAQRSRVVGAVQRFGESPLHPATHPNTDVVNTSTTNPTVIVLLRAFCRIFSKKQYFPIAKTRTRWKYRPRRYEQRKSKLTNRKSHSSRFLAQDDGGIGALNRESRSSRPARRGDGSFQKRKTPLAG